MPAQLTPQPPAAGGRMTFNIFSPLPPVRSEIANITLLIATALQDIADITLWTAQPELPEVPQAIPVQRFDPAHVPWPLLQQAHLNIYNLGNNATFHRAIFEVARRVPGLIVLHDTRLQHFFARYSETPGPERDFYLECMRRSHGLDGVADATAFLAGELTLDVLVDRYPMTLAVLDGALAAVIHNGLARETLADQTRTPVFYLPLPFTGPGMTGRPAPADTLRLITFGFMGTNRRLSSILDALAGHGDQAIQLDIYGVLEQAEAIEAQTANLGLGERVRQHGFVPEAELTAALARADLALNLRFPSMGEASASQLRIWDAGLPSLVTRTGWYAALPEDAVFFVEPDDEVDGIRTHLAALRADPAPFRQAGLRGRAILQEQHTPAAYAAGLLQIARQAPALHGRRQAIALSRTAAHLLMEMAELSGIGACADRVAEAVTALTQPR
jgi:glycosyltransferase involved in cell wall biosynthesis